MREKASTVAPEMSDVRYDPGNAAEKLAWAEAEHVRLQQELKKAEAELKRLGMELPPLAEEGKGLAHTNDEPPN